MVHSTWLWYNEHKVGVVRGGDGDGDGDGRYGDGGGDGDGVRVF